MKERRKAPWKPWVICGGIALAIALAVAYWQGATQAQTRAETLHAISDGCFVAGMMLTSVGGLTVIATTGFFDIFGYAMRSLLVLFSPLRSPKEHPKFYDYKLARDEKRRAPQKVILWVGLIFIGLALLADLLM